MTPQGEPSVRGSTALKDVTALVDDELGRVRCAVADALRPENGELRPLLDHVARFRGKQLRPALVLLVAKALGNCTDAHIPVAAIVELIHAATLVHDDILDGAIVRRQLATLNAIHGSEVSVLLGDYIYAKAFHMSVLLPDQRCSRLLAEVTRVICQGEMTQMLHRWDLDLTEAQYLRVIGEKTGVLYGASSELGALYAAQSGSAPHLVRDMRDFGYNLGLAFQIIDDCLDVEGDESVVGKSLGTDFGKGKLTLPFLWVLRGLDESGRRRFAEIFRGAGAPGGARLDMASGNGVASGAAGTARTSTAVDDGMRKQAQLASEFDLAGGLNYAHERADGYLRTALTCLDRIPGNEYLDALRSMADFVLHRKR